MVRRPPQNCTIAQYFSQLFPKPGSNIFYTTLCMDWVGPEDEGDTCCLLFPLPSFRLLWRAFSFAAHRESSANSKLYGIGMLHSYSFFPNFISMVIPNCLFHLNCLFHFHICHLLLSFEMEPRALPICHLNYLQLQRFSAPLLLLCQI